MTETLKILILDDEPTVRELTCEMLQVLSYKAEAVGTSDEAVDRYRQAMEKGEPFDLVIFDINLRGDRSGFETLEEIKKINAGVRAIAATGFIAPEAEAGETGESHFDVVINKPYTISVLEESIQNVMNMDKA